MAAWRLYKIAHFFTLAPASSETPPLFLCRPLDSARVTKPPIRNPPPTNIKARLTLEPQGIGSHSN